VFLEEEVTGCEEVSCEPGRLIKLQSLLDGNYTHTKKIMALIF